MSEVFNIPRVLICAPSSGSGKTLVTCALMDLLKRKGYKVSGFKCGPDYIDPMFHRKVLGIPSRNLDLFLAGREGVVRALHRGSRGSDISVIEGVMGFFDGNGVCSEEGSSYDLCKKTKTPAILVVNARGMSRSVIPLIKGFTEYLSPSPIKGVILNNISASVYEGLRSQIEDECGTKVLGFLPKLKEEPFSSRHLGLVMPEELPGILDKIHSVSDKLAESFDLEGFLSIAGKAGELEAVPSCEYGSRNVKVGVARDEAFCFYYEENLELLEKMGAKITYFSPIHDKSIPDVTHIILGGGYPELYAGELSENVDMRRSIKEAALKGMPILAECGGFLYLQRMLRDMEGRDYEMAGLFDECCAKKDKLSHFGYVNVTRDKDNPYLEEGQVIRGHEFHYYDTENNGDICTISKPSGNRSWKGCRVSGNVFAGFAHLYYESCPEFIWKFLNK